MTYIAGRHHPPADAPRSSGEFLGLDSPLQAR